MKILGANNYSLHTGGENYWIDFYYKMTPAEITETKRVKLLNELNKLNKTNQTTVK